MRIMLVWLLCSFWPLRIAASTWHWNISHHRIIVCGVLHILLFCACVCADEKKGSSSSSLCLGSCINIRHTTIRYAHSSPMHRSIRPYPWARCLRVSHWKGATVEAISSAFQWAGLCGVCSIHLIFSRLLPCRCCVCLQLTAKCDTENSNKKKPSEMRNSNKSEKEEWWESSVLHLNALNVWAH